MHLFSSHIVNSRKRGKARGKVAVYKTACVYYIKFNFLDSQSHFVNLVEIKKEIEVSFAIIKT